MESPEEVLLSAAAQCDVQRMTTLLQEIDGIDLNCARNDGMTPLMLCASAKKVIRLVPREKYM